MVFALVMIIVVKFVCRNLYEKLTHFHLTDSCPSLHAGECTEQETLAHLSGKHSEGSLKPTGLQRHWPLSLHWKTMHLLIPE